MVVYVWRLLVCIHYDTSNILVSKSQWIVFPIFYCGFR